jgi:hypothetical protein
MMRDASMPVDRVPGYVMAEQTLRARLGDRLLKAAIGGMSVGFICYAVTAVLGHPSLRFAFVVTVVGGITLFRSVSLPAKRRSSMVDQYRSAAR